MLQQASACFKRQPPGTGAAVSQRPPETNMLKGAREGRAQEGSRADNVAAPHTGSL